MYIHLGPLKLENWGPPCDSILGTPLHLLVKLLQDLVIGIHNTAICQKKGIQSDRTHNKFLYCVCLPPPPPQAMASSHAAGSEGSLPTPLTGGLPRCFLTFYSFFIST